MSKQGYDMKNGGEVGLLNQVSRHRKKHQNRPENPAYFDFPCCTYYRHVSSNLKIFVGKDDGRKRVGTELCAPVAMPKKPKELSPVQIKRLTVPGLYAVGGVAGLQLKVAPGGSRSWILRTIVGNRRRDIGLGGFPDVTLEGARHKAREAKADIGRGVDPIAQKRVAKASLVQARARGLTFRDAAIRCHATKAQEFRNDKHCKQWLATLERYAFPVIGNLPVSEIGKPEVLRILEPIWQEKTETASRLRQRIESVFAWAIAGEYRAGDNPARWREALAPLLAKPGKIHRVQHFAALPWKGLPKFMQELRAREGTGARALEFAILTAARSGEVRGMRWDEIDYQAKLWTIPAERMKGGKAHRVPLSAPAFRILKSQPAMEGSPYVFAAARGGMLSDVTLLAVLRRMNVQAVPHGFRSSFKDWARSEADFADEVTELALAHVNSDATRAAYARDELLSQRAKLMQQWAAYCSSGKAGRAMASIQRSGRQ